VSAFPNWRTFAVPQRRLATGCIPTGYEFLARAAQMPNIDFESFQDDFDLDKDKDISAGDTSENHFNSVADAVLKKYPQLVYECIPFDTGARKIQFIDEQVERQHPVLLSLAMQPLNGNGWHIMPVVDSDDDNFTLLLVMTSDRKLNTLTINRQMVEYIHDKFPGGKEVAFLNPASAT
jgi:hypothetical protein